MSITLKKKGDFKLDKSVKAYSKFKKRIPNILATNTVNHFKKGFTTGGKQTNDSIGGWKERQHRKGGNTLVKTGTLQRDIQKRKVSFPQIIVGTSSVTSDYAQINNEGGTIRITEKMRKFFWSQFYETKDVFWKNLALHKGSTITIPKREYIGDSDSLDKKNLLSLRKGLDKVFEV